MIKQINLKIVDEYVIAYMNDEELFKVCNENKKIDIDALYKKMAISKDDSIENIIEEIHSRNKSLLEVLYDNTKIFLDELIKKINDTLLNFDIVEEEKILIKQ